MSCSFAEPERCHALWHEPDTNEHQGWMWFWLYVTSRNKVNDCHGSKLYLSEASSLKYMDLHAFCDAWVIKVAPSHLRSSSPWDKIRILCYSTYKWILVNDKRTLWKPDACTYVTWLFLTFKNCSYVRKVHKLLIKIQKKSWCIKPKKQNKMKSQVIIERL